MKKCLSFLCLLFPLILSGCGSSKNQSSEESQEPVVIIIERGGSNWVPNEDDIPDMEYKFD